MKDLLTWERSNQFDLITYIPASESHRRERGFDPVWQMYHQVFELKSLLIKADADKPQAQKNRNERLKTPQTFSCISDHIYSEQTKVLIVDDIYTTGRTILHAKMALKTIGLTNIYTFSLSR
ncbi:ComF family protein [Companilactobacillus baiquanensis]|uniref:ComF family protein n=1 Tax=Companilactobacillus baiquanensis TaxID=2486005 RepID=A0ABW1UZU6_9LACO|nr:phosphoribosyltransferase family protein [Companilactobacillus baiquanensis]